jgi:RNA ligase
MLETLEKYYNDGLLYKQVHPHLPLTIWNYSERVQFENLWDEILLQTRGLVTDNITGEVVARPFKKFHNIEEGKYIPTSKFDVYEKMDGSLLILFNYKGEWIFATRGSFISDQAIKAKEIFYKKYDDLLLSRSNTYLFEIIYKENRIVVDYGDTEDLIMLGEIHTLSNEELDLEFNENLGFNVVKKYDGIKDYTQLKQIIKPNQEGYVIKFSNGDRIKIKGEEYLRLHRIMTNISTTSIWECLKNGDDIDKLLKDVPDEFYNKIQEYITELNTEFIAERMRVLAEYKVISFSLGQCSDKTFALFIKDNQYKSYLFALRNGKDITQQIWRNIKPKYEKL